ncbi:apolipoprotein N-acyltransferase [Mycobacterium paraense]|uniref:Apolipoprotein N-acyltransferase n=1 Tax=Mycobacterium paraense TaxID=767916 RepID=A0ABX3VSY4_9MYCO|nr:apolipoprotein N-acyltransferase [Mycobacterium paraense]ORW34632.1 apolipoprotein N-acyltransferase [Mycobacterium paraense]
MAREWFGREERSGQDPEAAPVSEDPISEEAESDRDDEPLEVHPAPEEPAPDGPGPADRLGALTRRALAALAAAAAARLPGVRAALVPRLPRLALAIAAGLLLFTSFPVMNWWWAAVVAAALLGWVLTRPATTTAGGFGYGFLFGLAFYIPLLPWISLLVGAVPWLALATTCALFPGLFGLCAVIVRRLPGWPVWFALVWAAQEWLKSVFPFGGFPWGAVAFGQTQGPLLPLVQLGGVALLSTAVMLVGFSATAIALEIAKWWKTGHAPQAAEAPGPPPAVLLPGVCISLVLFAAVLVWPQVRHAGAGAGGDPSVTVAAVQGNVPRLGLDFNSQRRAVLDNHVRETLRLADDVRSGAAPQPQFVIWPEDSSDIDPLTNADAAEQVARAVAAIGAPILIGTVLDVPGRTPESSAYTNTVIVWNPVSGPADRHDKEIVQPFGEYLPMPWLFKHLSGYADRAGHMVPGKSSGVVHIAGVPVGVSTCWEVIFDRAPRKAVRNGAQLLAVPSNNATFNKTMSEQQLAFAKVRAVEHDRYVVVAGTTGISAVIAPDGAELARTDFFEPAYLDMQVRLKTKLTPATRWAPILQWVLVLAAGAAILVGIRHNGWFVRPVRLRSRPRGEPEDAGTPPGEPPPDEGDAQTAQDAAPEVGGGDDTPPDEGGQPDFGRHRGAT